MGFQHPQINTDLCVNCGACVKTCPVALNRDKLEFNQQAFAARHKKLSEIKTSRSGAAFMALAKKYRVPVYAAVSNMGIALRRMEYLRQCDCFVCNLTEASLLFNQDLGSIPLDIFPGRLQELIIEAGIHSMVITAGKDGCFYASDKGIKGQLPSMDVRVIDTTGAGDAFFAGTCSALIPRILSSEKIYAMPVDFPLPGPAHRFTNSICFILFR